jgi:hypothetical protein
MTQRCLQCIMCSMMGDAALELTRYFCAIMTEKSNNPRYPKPKKMMHRIRSDCCKIACVGGVPLAPTGRRLGAGGGITSKSGLGISCFPSLCEFPGHTSGNLQPARPLMTRLRCAFACILLRPLPNFSMQWLHRSTLPRLLCLRPADADVGLRCVRINAAIHLSGHFSSCLSRESRFVCWGGGCPVLFIPRNRASLSGAEITWPPPNQPPDRGKGEEKSRQGAGVTQPQRSRNQPAIPSSGHPPVC